MRAVQPRERDSAVLGAVGQIELGQVVWASVDYESLSRVHAVEAGSATCAPMAKSGKPSWLTSPTPLP